MAQHTSIEDRKRRVIDVASDMTAAELNKRFGPGTRINPGRGRSNEYSVGIARERASKRRKK